MKAKQAEIEAQMMHVVAEAVAEGEKR